MNSTMKRRGNPNWGKPESGPVVPVVTEFEKTADEYKLTPDQYLQSSQLREWARGVTSTRSSFPNLC